MKLSITKILKYGLLFGVIGILITISLTYIVPVTIFPLTVSRCLPSSVGVDLLECVHKNNIWYGLEQITGSIGLFIVPLIFGIALGLVYGLKNNLRYLDALGVEIIAMTAFLFGMAVWEILHYRPWDSVPYNHYTLNAIYGTPASIGFFFLSLVAFNVTVVLSRRYWSNFTPFKNFRKKEPGK
jgi:hypothetical protein